MQIKEYLDLVCEQIKYKPIREEISNEIRGHIEDIKEELISSGESDDKAEELAIEQMGDGETVGKKLNQIHRPKFDFVLAVLTVVLLGFGFVIAFLKTKNADSGNYIVKNIKYIVAGLVVGVGIYFFDFKKLQKYSWTIYLVATLVIVWSAFNGNMIAGLKYFVVGSTSVSPATIAIPLYIISFCGFLESKSHSNLGITLFFAMVSLGAIMAISTLTRVFLLGLSYMIILTVQFALKKESKIKIALIWILPIVFVSILFVYDINNGFSYRFSRIQAFLDPEADPQGDGWLTLKRREIINSAKLFGAVDDFAYIQDIIDSGTDYAFMAILAHYGWMLSFVVVLSIIAFNAKIILNSLKIKDSYGRLLCIGIAVLFILQSLFSVLVNLNLFIDSGFSLPFISYGGCGLFINIVCLAIVFSVYRKKDLLIGKSDQGNEDLSEEKQSKLVRILNIIFEEFREE